MPIFSQVALIAVNNLGADTLVILPFNGQIGSRRTGVPVTPSGRFAGVVEVQGLPARLRPVSKGLAQAAVVDERTFDGSRVPSATQKKLLLKNRDFARVVSALRRHVLSWDLHVRPVFRHLRQGAQNEAPQPSTLRGACRRAALAEWRCAKNSVTVYPEPGAGFPARTVAEIGAFECLSAHCGHRARR